jgi:ubiquinone biosynthesis protein UbiJ
LVGILYSRLVQVFEVASAKAQLDAHRVKQDGDIQIVPDMVKLITFYDPDGNAMMFAQSLVKGS